MCGAGKYLRKLRQERNLSLDDVVKASSGLIEKTNLSRTENNERKVSLTMAFLLSAVYEEPFEPFAIKILKLQGLNPRLK